MKLTRVVVWFCLLPAGLCTRVTYEPTWASLDSRPTPAWWTEQKFSLFMHWGLYAVPSYCPVTESQPTCYAEHFWDTSHDPSSAQHAFMKSNYGARFEYQDFAPLFRCEVFDPTAWAALFKASGAQGLTMTSKHHEGWTLWPNSRHANWNSVDTGPHRDLLRELGDAVRSEGMRFGFYYSLMEWDRLYTDDTGTENARSKTSAGYVNDVMIPDLKVCVCPFGVDACTDVRVDMCLDARDLKDLATRYEPDVLYVDGEWSWDSDRAALLFAKISRDVPTAHAEGLGRREGTKRRISSRPFR